MANSWAGDRDGHARVRVTAHNPAELGGRVDDEILCETRDVDHEERAHEQVLGDEVAVRDGLAGTRVSRDDNKRSSSRVWHTCIELPPTLFMPSSVRRSSRSTQKGLPASAPDPRGRVEMRLGHSTRR